MTEVAEFVACEHGCAAQLTAVHLALFDVCGITRAEDLRSILQEGDIESLRSACRPRHCVEANG